MPYCTYYQATILRKKTWLFVAILRSFENLLFDRAVDKMAGVFEFFIPPDLEQPFLDLMQYFEKEGIVSNVQKLPNRLIKL